MDWFWSWLKQPSTLRVLNMLLVYAGYQLAPEMWETIVAAGMALYVLIDGFLNQQPAKPE
jgi:hypothetical protein